MLVLAWVLGSIAWAEAPTDDDPYLWLEDITGERAMAWVKDQNRRSSGELEKVPGFDATRARLLSILDSKEKIPWVTVRKGYLYNFWTDDAHVRGLWRRTTLPEYEKADPAWEILLDLDALGKTENESWVWEGATCLFPDYTRCLVSLSRGGADATVIREFDIPSRSFVKDGFSLPEAKSQMDWKDLDNVYVGTDFGPGTYTDSGYPRIVKEWKRGTPLAAATTILEGKTTDVEVAAYRQYDHGRVHDIVVEAPTFFTDVTYYRDGSKLVKVDKPDDAMVSWWDDQMLVTLRSDWTVDGTTWPAGSMLAEREKAYRKGKRAFTSLFTPAPNTSLANAEGMKSAMLVTELEDVHDVLYVWHYAKAKWTREKVATPPLVGFSVSAWDADENDDYWVADMDFLAPTSLDLVRGGVRTRLKQTPAFFDATGLEVTQHFVASKDGTKVPYFQVAKQGLVANGSTPTIIEGYGGFEVSLTPYYSAAVGVSWLEKGGVYVVPNLRGGGEYGPAWHKSAIKENRQRVYDDFAAMAQDLIDRKVTRPDRLGIVGGSNGGLLVGVMMTERPDLFGAVVCEAPLLDMKRYSQLLAGASWMDEYGDPSVPAEWAWISKYSPYQNVHADTTYPRVLFTTSTRDDRVHPGHARKMAARMEEQKHDVLFYENVEGGHAGSADNPQRAYMSTLAYAFLWEQLGMVPPNPARASPTAEPR